MFIQMHWLSLVLLVGAVTAVDVPFVFTENASDLVSLTSEQIAQASTSSPDLSGVPPIYSPSDSEVLEFPVAGGGSTPEGTTEKKVGELKNVLDARVEPGNFAVHKLAGILALKHPGDKNIAQIASIYDYLKNGDGSNKGWGYIPDPRGMDYFMYANETLSLGKDAGCVGGGDCDDFAILMSALIESVGGTTRIILARNESTGGHAYTEVYLGSLSEQNSQVEDIIAWLRQEYGTDKIYTHIDTDIKDVWLNLDWGPDEKGNAHPGRPFYQGDKHIVLCIRDSYGKTPLRLPDDYPLFEPLSIRSPYYNENISMNATDEFYVVDNKSKIEYILFNGTPLKLKDGYELVFKSIDIDGNKIYLELIKDSQIVDSSLIEPSNDVETTYSYIKGHRPVIMIHFKNSFRGADQNRATIDGIWQASEDIPSRLIINNTDAITLSQEAPLRLGEGYVLVIKSIDIDGNKIYLGLIKDGQIVDSSVIKPSNDVETTYVYTVRNISMIKINFKNAFRGVDQSIATVNSIWQASENNPSRVILNSNDERTLTSEEPLKLEEGYELYIKSMALDANRIYLELIKDGQIVDSSILVQCCSDYRESSMTWSSNIVKATYAYNKKNGHAYSTQLINIHFKNSFRGVDQSIATVDRIWQASESDPTNVILTSNEERIFTTEKPLRLEEGYELSLKSTDIDGNKIYLELIKDSQIVDSSLIEPSNDVETTYSYIKGHRPVGRESLIGFNFVIWKYQQLMQTPDMIYQTCMFRGAI